jgi:hypothetical protein
MPALVSSCAALAVAGIYYGWRAHAQGCRQRTLRSRVTYMLWVMAQTVQ